ncbi:MAG: glycosyltransferase family 39 protein [Gaiellaceae bacterium MAG52_C11]|nr:glycosyltransferase family 39 protein [Candidatus Gaiellasilicea maunaloa]
MKWLERVPAWAVLTGLVAASTALRSLAARGVDSPWIAPDEIVYALLGRSLWESGELSILGADTGFYSLLYPALVGGPLSVADAETGHAILHMLQALVVSCTAIPVYLWGRRLMRAPYALAAATLTLALPALGYSALVMSETLFLPVAMLALWSLARTLERPTAGRQAVLALAVTAAVVTRLQALVFVPVFVTAVLVQAALDRDRFVLRRFAPALGVVAVATAVLAVLAGSGSLGAYAAAGEGSYDLGAAARFVGYHAAGVILISGIVPALALLLLWLTTVPAPETPRALRAFLAVTLAYIPWLVLEVGVFASREIGHLAGRDLATAAPLTLLGFAVWLDRGAPRPQPLTSFVALAAAAGLLVLPIRRLAEIDTIHDTLELIPLSELAAGSRELAFALAVATAIALLVLLPRRFAGLLPPVVLVALAFTSVVAAREAERQSGLRETALLGGSPSWVDDAGVDGVAYLYAGEPRWTVVWQHLYWNRSIDEVWTLAGSTVPGPLPQQPIFPRSNGRIASAEGPLDAPAVIAPTNVTLVGERIAEIRQQGLLAAGLVLWRPEPPTRAATVTTGVLANGDIVDPATMTVFACTEGRLEATLLGKAGNPVSLRLDGITRRVVEVPGGTVWRGVLETKPYATEDGICEFGIASEGLLGSTRLEFVRR